MVHEFYRSIDVHTHFSKLGESFGYTIAEAMASMKPVVVMSTPLRDNAQIELVDNGVTGFVVASTDAFAKATAVLLKNKMLAKRMGHNGFNKIFSICDARNTTRMLEKIFIETMLDKGIKVEGEIQDRYKNIELHPSKEELSSFTTEYDRRLLNCFGGISLIYLPQIMLWKVSGTHLWRHFAETKIGKKFNIRLTKLLSG